MIVSSIVGRPAKSLLGTCSLIIQSSPGYQHQSEIVGLLSVCEPVGSRRMDCITAIRSQTDVRRDVNCGPNLRHHTVLEEFLEDDDDHFSHRQKRK